MRKSRLIPVGFTIGLLVAFIPGVQGGASDAAVNNPAAQQMNELFVTAAAKANASVVTIVSERIVRRGRFRQLPRFELWGERFGAPERESRGTILGSGVIFDAAKGYIVTNNHVVEGAEEIKVLLGDRREVEAELVGTDRRSDLAVIRIKASGLKQIERGDSDKLRIGEWVLAIGSPFGTNLQQSVSAGIVSAKGRSAVIASRRAQTDEDFIQTDAAINPGNSGGALINLAGELVGINTAIATDGFSRSNAGVGFAIPITLVNRVVVDLIEHGRVTRAWLGVMIQPLTESIARAMELKIIDGAVVIEVLEDSPADKAGLKEGDVIVKVDKVQIVDANHLTNVISSSRPGDRRKLTFVRKGKDRSITVRLGELDAGEPLAARDRERDYGPVFSDVGLRVAELDSRDAARYRIRVDYGVVVTDVDPRSDAAEEGIREGDVIVRVGEEEIEDLKDYRAAMKKYREGDSVLLRVMRGESVRFVGVKIG